MDYLFEIKEHIGVLMERPSGWRKELNIVSWNGGAPKYDIREWDEAHEKMTRGITLTEEEFAELVRLGSKRLNGESK